MVRERERGIQIIYAGLTVLDVRTLYPSLKSWILLALGTFRDIVARKVNDSAQTSSKLDASVAFEEHGRLSHVLHNSVSHNLR